MRQLINRLTVDSTCAVEIRSPCRYASAYPTSMPEQRTRDLGGPLGTRAFYRDSGHGSHRRSEQSCLRLFWKSFARFKLTLPKTAGGALLEIVLGPLHPVQPISRLTAARAPSPSRNFTESAKPRVRRLKARYTLATVKLALSKYRNAIRDVDPDHLVLRPRKMRSGQRFSYLALEPEETRALNAAYHERIHHDQSNLIRWHPWSGQWSWPLGPHKRRF